MSEIIAYDTYVSSDELKCFVTDESITLAKNMPKAAWNDLPDWHGYTLVDLADSDNYVMNGCATPEEYIKKLASDGFDFVRVPLQFNNMFKDGKNTSYCNLLEFELMDKLVNDCAKYGIHVCFDLHDMPGFTTNSDDSDDYLWKDTKAQKRFKDFWSLLAKHFANVPSNLVSFNLLNEPHPGLDEELTDTVYTKVMMSAINAIREVTPDRLIFTDFLGMIGGHPVEGLADAQVAQAAHPYFLNKRTQTWPCYAINGFVHKNNGDLTLKGSFKKNTEVTVEMLYLATPAELTVFADDKELSVIRFGDENLGENGCIEINDEGTKLEWRRYSGRTTSIILPEDCGEIRLVLSGDSYWYYLQSITIGDVYIVGNDYYISDTDNSPILTISANGMVSAEVPSTLKLLDIQTLREQFASYKAFTDRTGEAIMVQEMGFHSSIPAKASLKATKDLLDVLKHYEIPWCAWCDNMGPIMDSKWAEANGLIFNNSGGLYGEESVYRKGSVYESYVGRFVADRELMELYSKYIKRPYSY